MRFKKGIILAAGKGTRLSPATKVTVKPLLPLYDKPLLYYALSNLIKAGIREVLFISQKKDIPEFRKLFGSGKQLGMKFSYTFQKKQVGIPDAINIAKKFILFLTNLEKDCINIIVETGKSPAFTGVPIRDSNINLAY